MTEFAGVIFTDSDIVELGAVQAAPDDTPPPEAWPAEFRYDFDVDQYLYVGVVVAGVEPGVRVGVRFKHSSASERAAAEAEARRILYGMVRDYGKAPVPA